MNARDKLQAALSSIAVANTQHQATLGVLKEQMQKAEERLQNKLEDLNSEVLGILHPHSSAILEAVKKALSRFQALEFDLSNVNVYNATPTENGLDLMVGVQPHSIHISLPWVELPMLTEDL